MTGAGARLGAAIAGGLAGPGDQTIVHYYGSRAGAQRTGDAISNAGGSATSIQADLYNRENVRALAGKTLDKLGGLDLLVCSAANFDRVELGNINDTSWDRALDLNLTAPAWLVFALADALRSARGSVVLITDAGLSGGYKNYAPYQAAKGGLKQLVRTLALELAPEARVNAVAPGTALPPDDFTEDQVQALTSKIPLRGPGGVQPIVQAVRYLSTARFATGTELVVDGGASLL